MKHVARNSTRENRPNATNVHVVHVGTTATGVDEWDTGQISVTHVSKSFYVKESALSKVITQGIRDLSHLIDKSKMNIGKKWSIEEETRLLDELTSDMTILEISNLHDRAVGGISARRCHIATRFYRDGMSMDEIMKRYRMTKQGLMTLRNRGLIDSMDVLKIKNSWIRNKMTPPAERLAKINEALTFAGGIRQNKWDYGKYREMYENNLKEAQKNLEKHKTEVSALESKCRLRGVDEVEIQKRVHQLYSHAHIQLLENVIRAKKSIEMLSVGTVEELTRQKIVLLEELAI